MNVLLSPIGDIVAAAGRAEERGAFAEASALWFAAAARTEELAEKRGMSNRTAVKTITAGRRAQAEECRRKAERRDAVVVESAKQLSAMMRAEEISKVNRRFELLQIIKDAGVFNQQTIVEPENIPSVPGTYVGRLKLDSLHIDELERMAISNDQGWQIVNVVFTFNIISETMPKGALAIDYGGEDNYGPLDDFEWRDRIIL